MEDHRRSRSSSSSHSHDLLHILGFVSFCKACKSLISKCCTNKNPSSSLKASSENKIRTKTKQDGDGIKLESRNPTTQQVIRDDSRSCDNHARAGDGQSPQRNPISARTNRLTRTMSHDSRSSSSYLSRNISRRRDQQQTFSGPLLKTMNRRNSLNDLRSSSSGVLLSRCGSTTRIIYSNSQGPMKPPPMKRELECTLEELCFGCIKRIEITRDVVSDNGETVEEDETLTIKVKPGWRRGTKITFEGVGNETKGAERGDVMLVVSEKPHPMFKRSSGDGNLEMRLEISLVEALTSSCDLEVPLLGGHVMNLKMEHVIEPGQERVVQGQGMPRQDGTSRGDLKVIFDVRFPQDLTQEQRHHLVSILLLLQYNN